MVEYLSSLGKALSSVTSTTNYSCQHEAEPTEEGTFSKQPPYGSYLEKPHVRPVPEEQGHTLCSRTNVLKK